jgi:hypothetical protein
MRQVHLSEEGAAPQEDLGFQKNALSAERGGWPVQGTLSLPNCSRRQKARQSCSERAAYSAGMHSLGMTMRSAAFMTAKLCQVPMWLFRGMTHSPSLMPFTPGPTCTPLHPHPFSISPGQLLPNKVLVSSEYSISPCKRTPYKGRIFLSDILGRRRHIGFVRESYHIRGGTL